MKHIITFESDDLKDIEILLTLGNRIGLKSHIETSEENERDLLQKVITKGGDTSYIPDPIAWQKTVRNDRNIP